VRCGGGAVHIFYRQLPCNVFLPCLLVSLYSGHNGLHAQLIKISNTVLCTVVVLNNVKSTAVFSLGKISNEKKKTTHILFTLVSNLKGDGNLFLIVLSRSLLIVLKLSMMKERLG